MIAEIAFGVRCTGILRSSSLQTKAEIGGDDGEVAQVNLRPMKVKLGIFFERFTGERWGRQRWKIWRVLLAGGS